MRKLNNWMENKKYMSQLNYGVGVDKFERTNLGDWEQCKVCLKSLNLNNYKNVNANGYVCKECLKIENDYNNCVFELRNNLENLSMSKNFDNYEKCLNKIESESE